MDPHGRKRMARHANTHQAHDRRREHDEEDLKIAPLESVGHGSLVIRFHTG